MRSRIQRSATLLLATFTVGALLLPFAHEFTHIRNLEHSHGRAAADFLPMAGEAGGVEFLVEERTIPHNPNCELCARLVLDVPLEDNPVVPLQYADVHRLSTGILYADRTPTSRQIRAPPFVS